MLDFNIDFVQRTIWERESKSLSTTFTFFSFFFFCVWEIGNLNFKSATNRIKCVIRALALGNANAKCKGYLTFQVPKCIALGNAIAKYRIAL